MSIIRRCAAVTLATGLAVGAASAPASAASHGPVNNQAGLVIVNVQLTDVLNDNTVIVQVPVAVALTLCDVNVNVLGVIVDGDEVTCDAFAQSEAGA